MPFVVVYDANVLFPNSLRDLLIRVAQADLVQARWTHQILDETFRSLKLVRPDLDPVKLSRTRDLMNRAVRDVLVTGYEPLIDILDLPDADDRHVLAAAIKANAQVIVTENTKDFPADTLATWNIQTRKRGRLRPRPDRSQPAGGLRPSSTDGRRVEEPARHSRRCARLPRARRPPGQRGRVARLTDTL